MGYFKYEIPHCSICLERLMGNVVAAKCGHIHHKDCLGNWLEYKTACPSCKAPIKKDQIYPLLYDIFEEAVDPLEGLDFLTKMDDKDKDLTKSFISKLKLQKEELDFKTSKITHLESKNIELKNQLSKITDSYTVESEKFNAIFEERNYYKSLAESKL